MKNEEADDVWGCPQTLRPLLRRVNQRFPSESNFTRMMRQCSYDLDRLRDEMGELWEPMMAYTLDRARAPTSKVSTSLMRELGLRPIPPADLARMTVPTTLIWGRHDRANRLGIAEAASARYGWPLHVIEDCADDPASDAPDQLVRALNVSVGEDARRANLRERR